MLFKRCVLVAVLVATLNAWSVLAATFDYVDWQEDDYSNFTIVDEEEAPARTNTSLGHANVSSRCPACPTLPSSQERQLECPTISPCPPPRRCPSVWALPVTTPSPCPACPSCAKPTPPGYERHAGHGAYRVHLLPLNWFDAQATCEREGAHLAVINSQEEADILKRILSSKPIPYNYVLMGFHDLSIEGSFYTVLDTPLRSSGYYKWAAGEPNDKQNEDCGGMYVSDMTLNDQHCVRLTAPFICEMP